MACVKCGGNIIQRRDDNEETISNRLKVYLAQTAPLTEYYQHKGAFHSIDGMRTIDEVQNDIFKVLEN